MDAEQDASPSVVTVTLDSDSCGELVEDLDTWHVVPAELATRFYRTLRQLS